MQSPRTGPWSRGRSRAKRAAAWPQSVDQLEMNTFFVLDREPGVVREDRPRPEPELEPERRPKPTGVPTPPTVPDPIHGSRNRFRAIDIAGRQVRASDVSAAIIAAAIAAWPPKTIALRILDREGHEVFGRQKAAER